MYTRKKLAEELATEFSLTKAQSEEIVKSAFAKIAREVNKGEPVQIAEFGTFSKAERTVYKTRNPLTGETTEYEGGKTTYSLKVSQAKAVKELLNN